MIDENSSKFKEDFKNIIQIGAGNFGKVFKAENCLDGNTYAIKVI